MKRYGIALAIVSTILVIAGIVSVGVIAVKNGYPGNTPPTSKYDIGPPDAAEMLELVNMERAKAGVPPLIYSRPVEQVAQMKTDDFVARNYYSHEIKGQADGQILTPAMIEIVQPLCKLYGENINGAYTSMEAINKWKGSAPHLKAMLDSNHTTTGFGISSYSDGYYVTEHFCLAR